MAGKKQSTQKKSGRPAAKKSAQSKAAPRSKSNTAKAKQQAAQIEQIRQRNQRSAIFWFLGAILAACLVLIPGENIWLFIHNVLRGLFGDWALILAVLMLYVAVTKAFEKTGLYRGARMVFVCLILFFWCAAVHLFGNAALPEGMSFFETIGYLYTRGVESGGAGLVGGMLGAPLASAVGVVGARILIVILLAGAVMLLTGTSLATLFRAMSRPAVKIHDVAQRRREERRLLEENRESSIDIPLGAVMPQHPVRSIPEEAESAAGVKISKITNLADDLAMNLAATGVRIEAPIPGKAAVGIEVPNKTKSIVRMRELIESNSFVTSKSHLTVALGRDIAGQVTVADLAKMPHVLIAGTTGSGKSVCINSLIVSLLYKSGPDDVRFLMIDPKVVELGIYNGIPHLLVPVVTDPRKAAGALNWAVTEMLKRYKIFAENNVRDLKGYNALAEANGYQDENGQPMHKMPQIVIIIDELSDLMMAAPNEVEDAICRLAQMARAAGMHLVVATQRPSVDVVTGLIKANIPSRIAFAVSSAIDSRTILDSAGAEKLLGQGDMLFSPVGAQKPLRIQGCFVSDSEIESVVDFVRNSKAVVYDDSVAEEIERNAVAEGGKSGGMDGADDESGSDPMLNEAIKCVVEAGQASTSLLQRRLRLGYARAGRLIDEMEQLGIVGPHEGSKPRQVLITYAQWLERNMQKSDADAG